MSFVSYQAQCYVCSVTGIVEVNSGLCHACWSELPWFIDCCVHCGRQTAHGKICYACRARADLTFADTWHIACHYHPPISRMIQQLKFSGQTYWSRTLAHVLDVMYTNPTKPQALIPVPLHPSRQATRGFNQAHLIAQHLARWWQIPVLTQHCSRIVATIPQGQLQGFERYLNVRNAFLANIPRHITHIGLVDDVTTTGHTVLECCKAIQYSTQVHTVEFLVVASGKGFTS